MREHGETIGGIYKVNIKAEETKRCKEMREILQYTSRQTLTKLVEEMGATAKE